MLKPTINRKITLIFLSVCVVVLAGINILLSASLADAGGRLVDLNQQETVLQSTLSILNQQAVSALSLTDLQAAAAGSGYTTKVNYQEISGQTPLAYLPPRL